MHHETEVGILTYQVIVEGGYSMLSLLVSAGHRSRTRAGNGHARAGSEMS